MESKRNVLYSLVLSHDYRKKTAHTFLHHALGSGLTNIRQMVIAKWRQVEEQGRRKLSGFNRLVFKRLRHKPGTIWHDPYRTGER